MTTDDDLKKYDNTYHDVLWIDDRDDMQAQQNYSGNRKTIRAKQHIDQIRDIFPNNYLKIDLKKQMKEAFDTIVSSCNKYNLVIFDMNMQNGFTMANGDYESMIKNFQKYNITCTEEKVRDGLIETQVMKKIAGVYLYLLLLTKGYPADRMIIYTGNFLVNESEKNDEKEPLQNYLKKYCTVLNFEGRVFAKEHDNELDLEQYYKADNSGKNYYRIRRLVQQACNYWRGQIGTFNTIPFNQVYGLDISIDNFKELLKRIEMMFPVILPSEPEQVYYQAARILCEYHEDKANIGKLSVESPNIYPFHMVCRNFRNWSSHNRFNEAKMSPEIFALFFCITLRTYFDDKQNNNFTDDKFYYETIYFANDNASPKVDKIKEKMSSVISGISVKKVFFDKSSSKEIICSELVYKWGLIAKEIKISDIFLSILFKYHKIKFDFPKLDNIFKNIFENTQSEQQNENIFELEQFPNIPTNNDNFSDWAFTETYKICFETEKEKI